MSSRMTKNLSQAELKALDGLFNICIRSGTVSHADLVDSMYGRGASALAKALRRSPATSQRLVLGLQQGTRDLRARSPALMW